MNIFGLFGPRKPKAQPAVAPSTTDHRDQARAVFRAAETFLAETAAADPDGRHQRTYRRLTKFRDIAEALCQRQRLSSGQRDAAIALLNEWNLYRRGRVSRRRVSAESLARMTDLLSDLRRKAH